MSLKNSVTPPGIYPGTVRLVLQRLNHYTITGLHLIQVKFEKSSEKQGTVLRYYQNGGLG
jgi:hypothetical protein